MTNTLLQNNLETLANISPGLAKTIQTTTMEGLQGEIVATKTQAPSLRMLSPETKKTELLHSAYDPLREAQRWAEGIRLEAPVNIIILGSGLGYHLLTFMKIHNDLLRHLVVIESDPRILRLAFSTMDMRPLLQREGIFFFAGADPDELPEELRDVRPDMIVHNCKILPHPPSIRCFPSYYGKVREVLLKTLTYDEVNMRTNMGNQGRNQFNLFMNLPAMARGYALKDCEGLLKGYPAIVCGAGPSLDKNVHCLKEVNGRTPLFIVDTAQNTFKKHGIEHDVVVTGDPTPLNFSHFEQVDDLKKAFLAFHPESQRLIVQKFVNHPYLLPLFDKNTKLLEHLFDLEAVYGTMDRAMNVGHLALHLALHMGCSPIILAGFDLAFPRRGGTTHSLDAAVSRKMEKMQADGTIDIEGKEGKAPEESGTMELVPGYYDDEVPTTVPFKLYIQEMEKTVAKYPDIEFIDATEGGAYFKGTVRMPLQEAMQKYPGQPGAAELLDSYRAHRPKPPYQQVSNHLADGQKILQDSLRMCDDLLKKVHHWGTLTAQKEVPLQEAHQLWNEFEELWFEMCKQELFDPLLGGSVQHIYFMRQRTARARDNSGNAFLELVGQKYASLLPEMKSIIGQIIHCIGLAISALDAYRKEDSESITQQ